jgi:hypothetical protein
MLVAFCSTALLQLIAPNVLTFRTTSFRFAAEQKTEPKTCSTKDFRSVPTRPLTSTPHEISAKRSLADWASVQDGFVAKVCKLIPDVQREPYRPVPVNRDYTIPPEGIRKHYDDRGSEEVRAGRYAAPILFAKHFVPLVNALRNHGRNSS